MQWGTQKAFFSVELIMNISKTLFSRDYKRMEYAWFRYSFFNCLKPKGVTLITRLRLGLIHPGDYKFRLSFQECLNPICSRGIEVETTAHFPLHCPNSLHERKTLLKNMKSVLPNIFEQSHSFINNVLLFGDNSLDDSTNTIILNATINYITSTKRLRDSMFTF